MPTFGLQFTREGINGVCRGQYKHHKGYFFSRDKIIDKKAIDINRKAMGKITYVYDLELNFLKEYKTVKEAEQKSMQDFGVQFIASNITSVCTGRYSQHKGYFFSHDKLH